MRHRSVVPGALAAHGRDLWLADRSQPLLLHIQDDAGELFQWTYRKPDDCRAVMRGSGDIAAETY